MPEEQQSQQEQIAEVTAVDFSNAAKQAMNNHASNWADVKNSMVAWLRTNVGQNVSTALSNMEDLVIDSAKDTAYGARDYLNDAKRHLLSLVKNPEAELTTHNSPPRANNNDGTGKTIADIIGWNNKKYVDPHPVSSQGGSSEESNSESEGD